MSAMTIVLVTHLPLIALAFLPRDAWKRAKQEPAVV
jgi:hypothetical protein